MNLRSRFDLEVYPQVRRSQKVWVIKDPVSLRYFQFRDEEYSILTWLDGRSSLEEIKERFERRFAPRRIPASRLHTFIANLHRNGLVISDALGQGDRLLARHHQQRRSSWLTSFANPLAIRFRGIDPEPILRRVYPKIRWIFSARFVFLCVIIVITASMLVVGQYDTFQSRLPEMNTLLNPGNWIWLAIALAMTKLFHEMGHALSCRHFGGECHEM
ncbi:MAG: PqqD family protein, partial [Planctomycetales bacterium]|nr:PqqD family protein [Planctomycetales bacterium]